MNNGPIKNKMKTKSSSHTLNPSFSEMKHVPNNENDSGTVEYLNFNLNLRESSLQ